MPPCHGLSGAVDCGRSLGRGTAPCHTTYTTLEKPKGAIVSTPKLDGYPKTFALADGTQVELRPLRSADHAALLEMFNRVAEDDLYYLKDTVTDSDVIRDWTTNITWTA